MPQVLPNPDDRLVAMLARTANTARALATQPNLTFADAAGQLAVSTGRLQQYPATGTNYTTGYGIEVPSAGAGSAPAFRIGLIAWTSPAGGARSVAGIVACDPSGYVRAVWDNAGLTTYDTTGALVATIFSY